jgi:predicted aspartyl protease
MPSLSSQYDPTIGPLINLLVSPPAVMMHAATGTAPSGQSPIFAAIALIDTGASITSITADLANQVGLPLIGKRSLGTAGGVVSANVYLADIGVPFGSIPSAPAGAQIPITGMSTAMMANIAVMEFNCPSPHFKMLLGRDIICQGVFTLGFDRRYVLSL